MYDLEDAPLPPPPLPGEVVMTADPDEAIERLATDLVEHANNCVRMFGDFHLALSGGEEPGRLYRRLMFAPEFRWIPWRRTHLWFVAERVVSLDDPASTFRVVNDFIGDHADIPPEQFHPIFAGSPTAAEDYEVRLREHLGWREKGQDRLDFVLLTVDEDGGTAGLAPHARPMPAATSSSHGDPAAPPVEQLVARTESPAGATVSMLPPLLNAARFVAILAAGPALAGGLVRAIDPDADPVAAPIRAIRPQAGELKWYVDPLACRDIMPVEPDPDPDADADADPDPKVA